VKTIVRRERAATSPTALLCEQSEQHVAGGDAEFVTNLEFFLEKCFIFRAL
jgi:hypothetical protein